MTEKPRIFLYGAGTNGRRFLACMGEHIPICAFLDGDPEKIGRTLDGIPILSTAALAKENPRNCRIFVVSQAWESISNHLASLGFMIGEQVFNGLALLGSHPVVPHWEADEPFQSLLHRARPYTLLDDIRLYQLFQWAGACRHLPGSWAEAGVYRGGSAMMLAERAEGKTCYFFDTFTGLPDQMEAIDVHQPGDFSDTSAITVAERLGAYPNAILMPGLFPDTASKLEDTFSFVHVDFDIYASVLAACAYFWPRMVPGGVMVCDDYGFDTCPGVAKAIQAYFDTPHPGVYLPTGQLLLIKNRP